MAPHRGERREVGLGEVRVRPHARVPLGHPARAPSRGKNDPVRRAPRRAGLAGGPRRVPGAAAPPHRHPGRHRAGIGRAAALSGQYGAVAVRHAEPLPGQRRGGPPPLGDGVPAAEVLRPRRPRRSGRAAGATVRRRRPASHAGRLQRGDARLALVLPLHVLHRPRREDAARGARPVRLRPSVAHVPVHARRRGASHVRRRHRRRPHRSQDR